MDKKENTEFVIFCHMMGGKKMYITSMATRPDNKILPAGYSTDAASAKTWATQTAVVKAIDNILNMHDRKFEFEQKGVAVKVS